MTNTRPTRRYLAAIFTTAAAAFVAVAAVGIATSDATPAPDGSPVPRATETVTVNPADWLCHDLTGTRHDNCVTLASRPAMRRTIPSGKIITSPDGPALVTECLVRYSGPPLDACLAQPVHKGMPVDGSLCGGLDDTDATACHVLMLRPAFDNGTISDPAGPALVAECRNDTALSPEELTACLTQPTEG